MKRLLIAIATASSALALNAAPAHAIVGGHDAAAGAYPSIAEVHLEANNRTWDTIAEEGDTLGVYTDSRPPYGCLGLSLRR